MRIRVLLVLLALALAPTARAGNETLLTAADVTERGRTIDKILDLVLLPSRPVGADGRSVLLLVDVTPSLIQSELPARLEQAMERDADGLANTRLGVALVGDEGRPVLPPTSDYAAVRRTVREICARPATRFQDVYADVRRVLPVLKRERGLRELVLVTLENGDAEDDLEATVGALSRAQVRCSVVAREAFLSDPWWAFRQPRGPKGTTFTGAEGAFIELPWGFRYQAAPGALSVPSGFAMYGLTRLAAATAGKVYVYYPVTDRTHTCIDPYWGTCPFCDGDHVPTNETYQTHRLRALAPLALSRREAIATEAADPYYEATLDAWEQLARYDLVYAKPGLRRSSNGVRVEELAYAGWSGLGWSVAFPSEAAHARRLLVALDVILKQLEAGIRHAEEKGGGLDRCRALAETTRLLGYVTRTNLVLFEAFATEVAPRWVATRAKDVQPPEVWPYPDGTRWQEIGCRMLSLCHGPRPFLELHLPGGAATRAALDRLCEVWDGYETRYAHTPFLLAARRTGLARFYLVVRPGGPTPHRKPDLSDTDAAVTLPERPARPGASSGGGAATPASGG